MQFDTTALRYVSSANADYLPAGAFAVPAVVRENTVTLAATSLAGESNGSGTLATLTFQVVAAKASVLTLSEVLLSDSNSQTFRPEVENGQITEPLNLGTDVTRDGIVNIQDLVLVASNFGQRGEHPADVNNDGVVNIADLVLVAGALGDAAAAPPASFRSLDVMFTRAEVEHWLTQARALNLTDTTSLYGLHFLEQLLMVLPPKKTVLLANYPNPFNPETWIPYQLANPADVTVHIYGINGTLVRTLLLGHQTAGIYQSRSRAAYWDGKNAVGESCRKRCLFLHLNRKEISLPRVKC